MIKDVDSDGNGTINFPKFLTIVNGVREDPKSLELMEDEEMTAVQEYLRGMLGVVRMLKAKGKDLGEIIRRELGGGKLSGMGDCSKKKDEEDEEMAQD